MERWIGKVLFQDGSRKERAGRLWSFLRPFLHLINATLYGMRPARKDLPAYLFINPIK